MYFPSVCSEWVMSAFAQEKKELVILRLGMEILGSKVRPRQNSGSDYCQLEQQQANQDASFQSRYFWLSINSRLDVDMAYVTVPASFEANLTLGDGTTGFSLPQALSLNENTVPNLYTVGVNNFQFDFQEHGVAYNETIASDLRAQASFEVQGDAPGFSLTVDPTPVAVWGINFAGRIVVKHKNGCERSVYLPGTRTYDPAGMTGTYTWWVAYR